MQADFDVEDFEDRHRSDPKAFVRFFIHPTEIGIVDGLMKYKDVEMCEIIVPGNQTNRPVKKVNDIIKRRFGQQYRRWKDSGHGETMLEGTMLSEVTWLTRSQVEELAYIHVRTLEQLAVLGDDVCARYPGMYDLKKKASAFIKKAKNAAPILDLQKQLDQEKKTNEVLQQNLDALIKRLDTLEGDEDEAPKPKRRAARRKG